MGFLDRFKKHSKENQKNLNENIPMENVKVENKNQNTTLNNQVSESNDEITREEIEKKADELREAVNKIDIGLGDEINKNFQNKLNQSINDSIVKKFGTDEEIAEMNKRKEKERKEKEEYDAIYKKYEQAKKLSIGPNHKRAISLFEEVIGESEKFPNLIILCYHGLIDTYFHINQSERAIAIANESIEFKKKIGKDYGYEENKIKFINELNAGKKLNELEKEGESLYYSSEYDEATLPLIEAIELGSTRYQTFKCLSHCYIIKRDLDSAINILNIGIKRIEEENSNIKDTCLHNERNDGLEDILENINHKIDTGEFKWDCLPYEKSSTSAKIKEAKAILKEGDESEGIYLLEQIMENGTYSNTVYYTLYQTYKKEKKYDDAIIVCDNAIGNLGYFSPDRFSKWKEYKNKIIKIKEKEMKK